MNRSARSLCLCIIGLIMVRATPAMAQIVKTVDLYGTWEGVPGADRDLRDSVPGEEKVWVRHPNMRNMKHTLILRPDSIFQEIWVDSAGKETSYKGYWRVSGDTIWWAAPSSTSGVKVTLQDQRLTIASRDSTARLPIAVYQRADTPKKP